MKYLFFIGLFLVCSSKFLAQNTDTPRIIFKGVVEKIEITTISQNSDYAMDRILFKLNCSLENTGATPIIFFQTSPTIIKTSIFELDGDDESINLVAKMTNNQGSSDGLRKSEWERLKDELDKPFPPSTRTFTLFPGKILNFATEAYLHLPRNPEKFTFSLEVNPSLNQLKERSPLVLQLEAETWTVLPIIIDSKVNFSEKPKLLNKLHKRWKDFGYLWTENIKSEHISIDLSSMFANKIEQISLRSVICLFFY